MAEDKTPTAKVEVVTPPLEKDPDLEARFGSKQVPITKPFEQLQDEGLSKVVRRAPESDNALNAVKWLEKYLQKIAADHGKRIKLSIDKDEYAPIFLVEINGVDGSISEEHIDALRKTRDLDDIEKALRAFLSGAVRNLVAS